MVGHEGGIPALIAIVRDGTAEGKAKAVAALDFLSVEDENKVLIAREQGIPALVELTKSGTTDVAAHIVCKRISNSEMQNPGLGTFNLGHYDTVVSHPSTTTVVVSTVSVLLLVIISTGAGIWIYKVRYC